MREYDVEWDGSNPEDARLAIPVDPTTRPQMGEHVIARDVNGKRWAARIGWDHRLGWVVVPLPPVADEDDRIQRR